MQAKVPPTINSLRFWCRRSREKRPNTANNFHSMNTIHVKFGVSCLKRRKGRVNWRIFVLNTFHWQADSWL